MTAFIICLIGGALFGLACVLHDAKKYQLSAETKGIMKLENYKLTHPWLLEVRPYYKTIKVEKAYQVDGQFLLQRVDLFDLGWSVTV